MATLTQHWRDQLVQDQTLEVLAQLQAYAEAHPALPWGDQLVLLQQRGKTLAAMQSNPNLSAIEIRHFQNDLNFGIVEILRLLPKDAQSDSSKIKPKGIRDSRFQWHILTLILVIKLFVLGFLVTLNEAGGLSSSQLNATFSILIPLIATYLGLMFRHFFDQRQPGLARPETYTSRRVQVLTYAVFFFYALFYFWAMAAKGRNAIEFDQLVSSFNWIEAVLGGLIGYVVASLFKAKK